MRNSTGALVLVALTLGTPACAGGRAAPSVSSSAAGCHASRTCPAGDGSYAWRPPGSRVALVCGGSSRAFDQFFDYRGRFDMCKLPAPADRGAQGGTDFFGPSTVSAGPVPLKQHQLRIEVNVGTRRPAVLEVDYGDGTHLQRAVSRSETLDLVHAYARTGSYYLVVSLRDRAGYLSVEGEGPFHGPAPGPRTRYCAYESSGKGGTLSATESLTCSMAQKLFSSIAAGGRVRGYRCRNSGLPPAWSDVGVETCTRGTRAFVFTSNP